MTELPFDPSQLNYIIVSLDDEDRPKIKSHLLRLSHEDRYMRFFATLSDFMIDKYAGEMLDLNTGRGFGVLTIPGRKLVAFAHVSRIEIADHRVQAELGISIDVDFRGKGLAKRLMDRVLVYCRANNVNTLYMSCLRENKRMQSISRAAGLTVVVNADEAFADLNLDGSDRATARSHEIAYEQISVFDKAYRHNQAMLNEMLGVSK
jgi:RimJ/RimL family protein N-acetyltransferase